MGAQSADPAGAAYDPDARPDEGPVREITLPSYWILRHEVPAYTVGRCIQSGQCSGELEKAPGGYSNLGRADRAGHPANGLTWAEAAALCANLGGRLPTEAEWEYAARGPKPRVFPWGAKPGCGVFDRRNVTDATGSAIERGTMQVPPCDPFGTVMVGDAFERSPFDVVGMGGNVAEWVADWYAPYDPGATTSPRGPDTGTQRVLRGGGWLSPDAAERRTSARAAADPESSAPDVGLRCVWDPDARP